MTYITRMTLRSGDRVVLDETVDEIKRFVLRKGAELTGPHPRPPTDLSVRLQKRLCGNGGSFPPWTYTIYTREMEIKGHNTVSRAVAERSYPQSVQVSIELDQVGPVR